MTVVVCREIKKKLFREENKTAVALGEKIKTAIVWDDIKITALSGRWGLLVSNSYSASGSRHKICKIKDLYLFFIFYCTQYSEIKCVLKHSINLKCFDTENY